MVRVDSVIHEHQIETRALLQQYLLQQGSSSSFLVANLNLSLLYVSFSKYALDYPEPSSNRCTAAVLLDV